MHAQPMQRQRPGPSPSPRVSRKFTGMMCPVTRPKANILSASLFELLCKDPFIKLNQIRDTLPRASKFSSHSL